MIFFFFKFFHVKNTIVETTEDHSNKMTSMWDYFPEDVKNVIYEMNPEHKEKFKSFKSELELKGVQSRLETLYNNFYEESDYSLVAVFEKMIDDPEYIIEKLNTCKCCSRHNTKKPLSLTEKGDYDSYASPWDTLGAPGGFIQMSKKKCKCTCRTYSRMIFEAFRMGRL